MVPLIAASKQRVDQETSNSSADLNARAKNMITKCLNRITTETEISGSHVSHFLLGYKDNKTSHKFTRLNLHCALAWLANEIKRYDSMYVTDERNIQDNHPDNDENHDNENDNDDNDDDDDDDNNDENSMSCSISTNDKDEIIFINQMTDYINRGSTLKNMCLYEYVSKVYKNKYTPEDIKKEKDRKKKNRTLRRHEERIKFSKDHPQYESHWQKVRLESSAMVPTLSKLPPSINKNRERHQMCILLLFKPFTSYAELCSASWNETYSEFLEITEYKQYIENIEELHKGIEEKEDNNDDANDDEIADDEGIDDNWDIDETDTGIDLQTTEALDIIKSTPWLNESSCYHEAKQTMQTVIEHSSRSSCWTDQMKKQNDDILNNDESAEFENQQEPVSNLTPSITIHDDEDIDISIERVDTQNDCDRIQVIVDDTIRKYSLNKKQRKAFELSIENVIKRYKKEETEQLIAYIGGPGGTGKSQVIKAIVDFHKKIKVKHTLKLTAPTGTAAKNIGGSTCHTLFGYSSTGKNAKIERRFKNVETIITDEVSMIGCRALNKISKKLTKAKCANKDLPFGGMDMIFFGDFIQFSPVKDTALYRGWSMNNKTKEKTNRPKKQKKPSSKDQSEINKQIGAHLWTQINHVVLLDEQMRVQDKSYLEMLNRLREGECTDRDVEMINGKVVGNTVDLTSIAGNPIIAPGNDVVTAVNDLFVAHHSSERKVYVSIAQDYIGRNKKEVPAKVAKKYENWPNTQTDQLPRELKLYIGMPVIVTKNIYTELGITNGTKGVVRSIHFKKEESVVIGYRDNFQYLQHTPDCIVVELDDINVKPLDGLPANHVPIVPQRGSFQVHLGGKESVSVNRRHFPLVPRFGCTAHKSQGDTLSKAIVDLVPPPFKKNVRIEDAYVPLSRVRRLDDLTVLRTFDPSILKAQVDEDCAAMMKDFKARDLCKDM